MFNLCRCNATHPSKVIFAVLHLFYIRKRGTLLWHQPDDGVHGLMVAVADRLGHRAGGDPRGEGQGAALRHHGHSAV